MGTITERQERRSEKQNGNVFFSLYVETYKDKFYWVHRLWINKTFPELMRNLIHKCLIYDEHINAKQLLLSARNL